MSLCSHSAAEHDITYCHSSKLGRHLAAAPNQKFVAPRADYHFQLQVRLLMCYVITHPEKMDDAKQQQWQRLSHLTDMDMNSINNLELLGVPVKKRGGTKGLGLTFGRKRKRAVRKASSAPACLHCLLSECSKTLLRHVMNNHSNGCVMDLDCLWPSTRHRGTWERHGSCTWDISYIHHIFLLSPCVWCLNTTMQADRLSAPLCNFCLLHVQRRRACSLRSSWLLWSLQLCTFTMLSV